MDHFQQINGEADDKKSNLSRIETENQSEVSDSDNQSEEVIEDPDNKYIRRDNANNCVYLTSPTFGDAVKIKNPLIKIGTSKSSMKELKHVEVQIRDM